MNAVCVGKLLSNDTSSSFQNTFRENLAWGVSNHYYYFIVLLLLF